tara:strand:- start:32202 stop:32900 length:699 start_codon:yes stop_codon:yes gene_type:complete
MKAMARVREFIVFVFLISLLTSCATLEDSDNTQCFDAYSASDLIEETDPPIPEPEPCQYPGSSGSLLYNEIFPELSWLNAYNSEGDKVELHFLDQYCGSGIDIAHYDSIILAIGAGWCPYCPAYMLYIDAMAEELRENNVLIIYAELQTDTGVSAPSDYAHDYVNNLGITSGFRVGDADTWPIMNFLTNSSDIVAYPTAFVIRTRDMRIIANQRDSNYYLDFRSITAGISTN